MVIVINDKRTFILVYLSKKSRYTKLLCKWIKYENEHDNYNKHEKNQHPKMNLQ